MSAFSKRHVILCYVYMYLCVQVYVYTGPEEMVRLFQFWLEQLFSQGESRIPFYRKQVLGKVLV